MSMRRRILSSMVVMVMGIALLLGVPLMFIAWWWVDDQAHNDLDDRLQRVSQELIAQERPDGSVPGNLQEGGLRLLVPDDGRLILRYATPEEGYHQVTMGREELPEPTVSESLTMGRAGSATVQIPRSQVREKQWTAIGVVAAVVLASIAIGMVVAAVNASRLADPLVDVAERAARIGRGDLRSGGRRYGVAELDRVSAALDAATREIALRLEREGQIVGEVSHQLRSRLTAIQLRLDELSLHRDPAVVTESEAALGQVERLSRELDELIAASRGSDVSEAGPIVVQSEINTVVGDFGPAFTRNGRQLLADVSDRIVARVTPARLREALTVLVDNALRHGGGDCTIEVHEIGGMIRLAVSDEGRGVSDEDAQRVFQRGYSGAGSTGVGLSLARAMIESDGGRLELVSRRPPTFAIVVPAHDGSRSQAPSMSKEPR